MDYHWRLVPWIIPRGFVRGDGTGLTGLRGRTRSLVGGAATGLTRLGRHTGGLVRGTGTGLGDWGDALEAGCVEQAPDTLGRGGALEVSSIEPAQPVLLDGYFRPANAGR